MVWQDSSSQHRDSGHVPVLLAEVIEALDPRPGDDFIDATVGGGGHAAALLQQTAPDGRLLAMDADPMALRMSSARLHRFGGRVVFEQANFRLLGAVAKKHDFDSVGGIILDLGLSSLLLERSGRGFSFLRDEPVDMRFDPSQELTAADILNTSSTDELAQVLREYGEEPKARAVARAIVQARSKGKISTTAQLVTIVAPIAGRSERIHPATRTFQALRMATNDELEALAVCLRDSVPLLRRGGRLAVISFHSLEDRIVKHFLNDEQRGCICPPKLPACVCGRSPRLRVVTKKPIVASPEEVWKNPRSRSAKLRVAVRLEDA